MLEFAPEIDPDADVRKINFYFYSKLSMRPEQWQRIEAILAAALEQPNAARPAFIAQACKGDDDLRREVESLLQADENAQSFLVEPFVPNVGDATLITNGQAHVDGSIGLIGKRIGAYKIEREIGRGGMGAVYLATRADNIFEKRVAIKIVKRGMDTDFILRRFRRERQILATLNHPNVAALLDGGSTNDGLPYFVMEYVEGQPINHYCNDRKLTVTARLHLIQQVCAAVKYAHEKQIVHRDIKPGNILVTRDGTVKLLDFGIAKLLVTDLAADTIGETATAVRLMTPEYASPEQVRGLPVTPACDVYSLGVLLYELLTGRRPYRLTSHAPHEMARVICEEEPILPSDAVSAAGKIHYAEERSTTAETLRNELAGNLDNIIRKALHKAAQHRYATAAELLQDIARHLAGEKIAAPQLFTPLALAPNILDETPTARAIAVLPLQVTQVGTRQDTTEGFLGIGIADVLTAQLSNIRGLVVRPIGAVLRHCEGDDLFAIGQALGVDYLLGGRVQLAQDKLRVTVQLTSLWDKAVLWAEQYNEKITDILGMQDSIASQVAEAIVPRLTNEDRARIAKRGTDNLQAYEAYLRARYYWHSYTMDSLAKALLHFNEAISLDPSYAAPYAGIAEYYNRLATFGIMPSGECFAAAKDAALKAVRLDESLAEAWGALAFATLGANWDRSESMRLINRALELNPNSPEVLEWYAHILASSGRLAEATTVIDRALRLDPGSAALFVLLSFVKYLNYEVEDSLRATEQAIRLDPNSFWALFGKTMSLVNQKRDSEALTAAQSLLADNFENPIAKLTLANVYSKAGNTAAAKRILDEVLAVAQNDYVTPFHVTLVHESLGQRTAALQAVARGIAQRDWWTLYLPYDPAFAALRSDSRCQTLLQKAGLIEHKISPGAEQATVIDTVVHAKPNGTKRWLVIGVSVLILLTAGFVFLPRLLRKQNTPVPTFQATTTTKLTSSGSAVLATISPDGKYIAYIIEESGRQSLWMRQVAVSSSVRLVPPTEIECRGLIFTPDAAFVRYVAISKSDGQSALYEVPALGGSARKMKDKVSSPISIDPKQKKIAFVRQHAEQGEDDLVIANLDGTAEQEIATRKFPEHFSSSAAPDWSPDGKSLVVVLETSDANGLFTRALAFNLADKKESSLALGKQRWMQIDQLNWVAPNHFLLTAQDSDSPFLQLWSIKDGQAQRLTNDMNDYKGMSLPKNFHAMLTVQRQTLINIWFAPKDTFDRASQMTTGAGRYFDLAWTPDKHVLYASDASGSADIWERQPNNPDQLQLTAGASRNYGPAVAPDGSFVVFHSNRSGNWQIWHMNRDGSNQTPLTSGNEESNWAQISPDGKWIVYEHFGAGSQTSIWKKSLQGGEPIRLTTMLTRRPIISPDGKTIACWSKEDRPNALWKIVMLSFDDGKLIKQFDLQQSDASGGSVIRWTPDGSYLVYIDFRNDITTLWQQPVQGGAPKKIMESAKQVIYSFDIARDGSLVFSRGLRANDVVLISDNNLPHNE